MRSSVLSRFAILRQRNFRLYWVGQLISLTGMWMQAVAGSWIVLQLTDSTFALAVVNFAVAIPGLLLTLYGGVFADRYNRRTIMVITQSILMVVALLTGALVGFDVITFWQLLLLSLVVGVATAFDMPAQQALVPSLVEPQQVPQAIALNQVIFNGSRLLGPAVAALTIAAFGLASAYFANGISYIAVITSLLLLRLAPNAARGMAHGSAWSSMKEGIGHVWASPLLRCLLGLSGVTSLFVFPCLAVLSAAYVKDAFGLGPGTAGLFMAASGGASMVGAFAMLWVPSARRGQVMLAAVSGAALSLVTLGLTHVVVVAVVAFGLMSLGMSLSMGLSMTTIQQITPNAIRGRVMGVSGLMFSGVMPFAAIIIGGAVELTNIRAVYGVCGAIYLLLAGTLVLKSGMVRAEPRALDAAPQPEPALAR